MSRHDLDSLMMDYLYDELQPAERQAFEARMAADEGLRREVCSLQGTQALLCRIEPQPAPQPLFYDLLRESRKAIPERRPGFFQRMAALFVQPVAATALLVLVVAATGLYVMKRGGPASEHPERATGASPPGGDLTVARADEPQPVEEGGEDDAARVSGARSEESRKDIGGRTVAGARSDRDPTGDNGVEARGGEADSEKRPVDIAEAAAPEATGERADSWGAGTGSVPKGVAAKKKAAPRDRVDLAGAEPRDALPGPDAVAGSEAPARDDTNADSSLAASRPAFDQAVANGVVGARPGHGADGSKLAAKAPAGERATRRPVVAKQQREQAIDRLAKVAQKQAPAKLAVVADGQVDESQEAEPQKDLAVRKVDGPAAGSAGKNEADGGPGEAGRRSPASQVAALPRDLNTMDSDGGQAPAAERAPSADRPVAQQVAQAPAQPPATPSEAGYRNKQAAQDKQSLQGKETVQLRTVQADARVTHARIARPRKGGTPDDDGRVPEQLEEAKAEKPPAVAGDVRRSATLGAGSASAGQPASLRPSVVTAPPTLSPAGAHPEPSAPPATAAKQVVTGTVLAGNEKKAPDGPERERGPAGDGKGSQAASPAPAVSTAATGEADRGRQEERTAAEARTRALDVEKSEEDSSKKRTESAQGGDYERAMRHYEGQRYRLAIRDFEGYLERNRDSGQAPQAQLNLARSYRQTNKLRTAVDHYRDLLSRYPRYRYRGAVLIETAHLEARVGDLDSALSHLREASRDKVIAEQAKKLLVEVERRIAERERKEKAEAERKKAGAKVKATKDKAAEKIQAPPALPAGKEATVE